MPQVNSCEGCNFMFMVSQSMWFCTLMALKVTGTVSVSPQLQPMCLEYRHAEPIQAAGAQRLTAATLTSFFLLGRTTRLQMPEGLIWTHAMPGRFASRVSPSNISKLDGHTAQGQFGICSPVSRPFPSRRSHEGRAGENFGT